MTDGYFTVKTSAEYEYVIERSRFIGYAKKVEDEEQAKAFVDEIRKKNSLATHNCYAYVVGENGNACKFSDDGEPQGTAGMPILEVIKNKNLKFTAVVVTRYFGGIKLGAGGLVRAYSRTCADVLDKAGISEYVQSKRLSVALSYDGYGAFNKFISGKKITELTTDFSDGVTVSLFVPEKDVDGFVSGLTDYLNGKVAINLLENCFKEYKI